MIDYLNQAGQPGSFKLPNPGQPGTAFRQLSAERMHPAAAAALGPRVNPANGGRPTGGLTAPAAGGPSK